MKPHRDPPELRQQRLRMIPDSRVSTLAAELHAAALASGLSEPAIRQALLLAAARCSRAVEQTTFGFEADAQLAWQLAQLVALPGADERPPLARTAADRLEESA